MRRGMAVDTTETHTHGFESPSSSSELPGVWACFLVSKMGIKIVSILQGFSKKRLNICSFLLPEISQFSMLLKQYFVKVSDLNQDMKMTTPILGLSVYYPLRRADWGSVPCCFPMRTSGLDICFFIFRCSWAIALINILKLWLGVDNKLAGVHPFPCLENWGMIWERSGPTAQWS